MKTVAEMTNDEFLKYVVEEGLRGWIPLKTYLRLFPEESKPAIETRMKRKHWQRGVHYSTPEGGKIWVNLLAIRAWVEGDKDEVSLASRDAPETLGQLTPEE